MPATYDLLAATTLGSNAQSVTLSSIPATHTDLRLVITASCTSGAGYFAYRYNGNTANNYAYYSMNGQDGAVSGAQSYAYSYGFWASWGFQRVAVALVDIFNYTSTNTAKTSLSRAGYVDSSDGGKVAANISTSIATTAVSSITIATDSAASFVAGSTFSLYGIAKA